MPKTFKKNIKSLAKYMLFLFLEKNIKLKI